MPVFRLLRGPKCFPCRITDPKTVDVWKVAHKFAPGTTGLRYCYKFFSIYARLILIWQVECFCRTLIISFTLCFFFSSIIYVDYYDITIALLHYYISKQHSHLKEILN